MTTSPSGSGSSGDPTTGDPTTGEPTSGTSTGGSSSSGDSGSSTTSIDGITIPFTVFNLRDGTPFADADVCFLENPSCDQADAAGEGELVGPTDTNLTFDVTGGGAFNTRYPVRFDDKGLDAFLPTLSSTDVSLLFLLLGYDAVPTEGTVAMLVTDENGDPLPGAMVNIEPAVALPPVYLGDDGTPDDQLTATSMSGLGAFIEVPAGDYEVWITHPTYDCPPSVYSWPGSSAEREELTVEDGYIVATFARDCTPSA